jgi:cellulose synthase (UDP-forming)
MTIEYQAAGYRGVYVPERLAAGITPVDWTGYLRQQRRWARSVLDVKFRVLPRLWRGLRASDRLASAVHGLHYLYPLVTVVGIALLAYALGSGAGIGVLSWGGLEHLAPVIIAIIVGDAYRQRFFLDVRREWGLHWRASLLRFAKWPALLVALWDVLRARRGPYLLTQKVRSRNGSAAYLLPHALVAAVLAISWVVGRLRGVEQSLPVEVLGGLTALISVAVFLTSWFRFPPPYSPELRGRMQYVRRLYDGSTRLPWRDASSPGS